ncbi:MAG: hemolysin III family protein, partial [Geodermatophilaceae bacterium]|nr:hemolysin III family protein [Geodermatophilaceae bacterium]
MIPQGTTLRLGSVSAPWQRNLRSRNLGSMASELASSVSTPLDFGDTDYDSPDIRPRLRGWLHQGAFFTSLATGAVLIPLGWAQSPSVGLAVTIYCFTVSAMFGVSAAYHRRAWSPRGWKIMKLLDHSTIFLFIAGSYTPFSVMALEGTFLWVILGIVWGGGLAGIALKTSWPTAPRWVGVPIYLALGWVAVLFFPAILTNLGVTTL